MPVRFQAYAAQPTGLSAPETREIPNIQAEAALTVQRLLDETVVWHWHDKSALQNVLLAETTRRIKVLVTSEGRLGLYGN